MIDFYIFFTLKKKKKNNNTLHHKYFSANSFDAVFTMPRSVIPALKSANFPWKLSPLSNPRYLNRGFWPVWAPREGSGSRARLSSSGVLSTPARRERRKLRGLETRARWLLKHANAGPAINWPGSRAALFVRLTAWNPLLSSSPTPVWQKNTAAAGVVSTLPAVKLVYQLMYTTIMRLLSVAWFIHDSS